MSIFDPQNPFDHLMIDHEQRRYAQQRWQAHEQLAYLREEQDRITAEWASDIDQSEWNATLSADL